jgi:hypothetical protein
MSDFGFRISEVRCGRCCGLLIVYKENAFLIAKLLNCELAH